MAKDLTVKLGAYFVIFIMVFSSIGFALYFVSPSSDKTEDANVYIDPTNTLSFDFSSEVNGSVKELTKTYMLIADTNISDIASIDKALLTVKGVSNVDSHYSINQDNSISATYKYLATISGYAIDQNTIGSDMESKTVGLLKNAYLYPYALVEFDTNVHFTNNDLNLTKDYVFGNPLASVLVMPNTLAGDHLRIALNVTFMGNSPTKISGYELENLDGSPKQIQVIKSALFEPDGVSVRISGKDVDKVNLNKLKEIFDGNISYDNNVIILSSSITAQDKFLLDLNNQLKDNNVILEPKINGTIFIDSFEYLNENYDYNESVPLSIDYREIDVNKPISVMLSVYLYRKSVLGIMAQDLGLNEE